MKQISILIADDDEEIANLVAFHLEKENYQVFKAKDGQEVMKIIANNTVDLLILDIMMPKMDGYEVTRNIREKHNMPIILLSARTSEFDKVQGLVIGADDYITKPFAPMELIARVNAQLRRFTKLNPFTKSADRSMLEFGELMISLDQRMVTLYEAAIELTPKEFDILYLLASHPKKVFSVENIFEKVWGDHYYESANTVMVHIRTLRKKLAEDKRKNKFIKTVWGVGYTFNG